MDDKHNIYGIVHNLQANGCAINVYGTINHLKATECKLVNYGVLKAKEVCCHTINDRRVQATKEEVDNLTKKLDDANADNARLQESIEELTEANIALRKELTAKIEECHRLRVMLGEALTREMKDESAEDTIQKLKNQIASLEVKVKQRQRQYDTDWPEPTKADLQMIQRNLHIFLDDE